MENDFYSYSGINNIPKGDLEHKRIIRNILKYGRKDRNPRPHYADGTPAHTLSYNGEFSKYDLNAGELPIITLRPIAVKSAIGEILWIYQEESNDLDVLRDHYNVTWWDEWEVGTSRTIGSVYGETVRKYDLMRNLLDGLKENPDGRRHIMSLWQEEQFKLPHGLKPCVWNSMWNVRHEEDADYLDMCLTIRSSDYLVAGVINQMQYIALQYMVAKHCGYKPGVFNFFMDNIQIYDRHIDFANEILHRKSIECKPYIWLNPEKEDFYEFTIDDIKLMDYPSKEIKEKNPNFKFDLGI